MKSRVNLSVFSWVASILIVIAMVLSLILTFDEKLTFITLLVIYLFFLTGAILYSPLEIKADNRNITVISPLRKQIIPIKEIADIRRYRPQQGTYRLFGSNGFMGYWGLFRSQGVGKYKACYGKKNECFLIELKNGKKYLLGCDNPDEMIKFIKMQD